MSSMIAKVLVAGLASFGAVQAYPQPSAPGQGPAPTSAPAAPPAPTQDNAASLKDLIVAPTVVKRFQRLLTEAGKLLNPEQLKELIVFDFNGAEPAPGAKGGATKAANIETFPILTDLGISTTLGFLNPCGMNTPHVHPRATEFLTVAKGSVKFGYILENGLVDEGNNAELAGTLDLFQGTVFPIGSIHYQFNPTCDESVFVATLNSEDPGTSQIAQNFFGLNPDVVNATLGFPQQIDGKDIEAFRDQIPANLALAVDQCLQACNIKPNKH